MHFDKEQTEFLTARLRSRLPLLITGAAGVAGFNAFRFFRRLLGDPSADQVIAQRPVQNWRLRGPGIVACDLDDREGVRRLVQKYGFRSVLSCGGSCALKSCELDPQMAERVNVRSLEATLDALDGHVNRLVHLSIDLVFSGRLGGDYSETHATDPVTVYGATMVRGETLVSRRRPDACILRISLPMGISFNGHAGAIDWIQSRFKKHRPATLFFDEVRTPTYVGCLNELVLQLLCENQSGLFHAGGPRNLSLYEIAQIVNRVGGYPPDLLHGCYRLEAGRLPPRAGNVCMNSEKLRAAVGRDPFTAWPLQGTLVPDSRNWHYSRKGFLGSPELLRKMLYTRHRWPARPSTGPILTRT